MFKEKIYNNPKVRVYTTEQKIHNAVMRKIRNPQILLRDDYDIKRTLESIVRKIELTEINHEKKKILKEIQNKRYREQHALFHLQQSYIPKIKKSEIRYAYHSRVLARHPHIMNPNNKKRTWSESTRLKTQNTIDKNRRIANEKEHDKRPPHQLYTCYICQRRQEEKEKKLHEQGLLHDKYHCPLCKIVKELDEFLQGEKVLENTNANANTNNFENDYVDEGDYDGFSHSSDDENGSESENDWFDNEHFCN
jgi:hypothetical protein